MKIRDITRTRPYIRIHYINVAYILHRYVLLLLYLISRIILYGMYFANYEIDVFFHIFQKQSEEEKVSIYKKFKKMAKDYWYVLVPVHVATSLVWFGGFYAMCKSGVDVAALLQTFGVSDAYVEKLSNSEMGYAALAYACYKIATPVR